MYSAHPGWPLSPATSKIKYTMLRYNTPGSEIKNKKKPHPPPGMWFCRKKLVPKAGVEPARTRSTAPSRQRVYQFHHFGTLIYCAVFPEAGISRGASVAGAASFVSVSGMGTVRGSLLAGFCGTATPASTGTFFITLPVLFWAER